MNATLGSMNKQGLYFAFGLADLPVDFDILNNPYVKFVGYEMTLHESTDQNLLKEKYELEICSRDYLASFLETHTIDWYESALCFKNMDEVLVKNNYFSPEYSFPAIGIAYCKDYDQNPDANWCKSQDETDDWLL